MAQVIIKAVSDFPYSKYYKNDVVEVLEDNQDPGKAVCLPTFFVIKVNKPVKDLLYLKESKEEFNVLTAEYEVTRKRKYIFDINSKVSKEQMDEIKASDWSVPEYEKTDLITYDKVITK